MDEQVEIKFIGKIYNESHTKIKDKVFFVPININTLQLNKLLNQQLQGI